MPLDESDVGSVDECGTTNVFDSDGAVTDVVVGDGVFEDTLLRAAEVARESASTIGCLDLAPGEHFLLGGDGGEVLVT